jgi:Tfp pilus assembly protein PilN
LAPLAAVVEVPAIGIGLASNDLTPNFLFTHRHREIRDRSRRMRIAMSAISIGFLFLLLGGFWWQEHRILAQANRIEQLTAERDAFNVPLTQDLVTALLAKVTRQRARIATLGNRYLGSAVISEVSQLTPDHIQLIALRIDAGAPNRRIHKRERATLTIEGLVTGEPIRFETDLASYMLTMESSVLLKTPTVKSKRMQFMDNRQVMRFSIEFELA